MRKWMMVCLTVAAVAALGCNQPAPAPTPPPASGGGADSGTTTSDAGHDHGDTLVYCATCGEQAHTEACCAEGSLACEHCGMNAGAALVLQGNRSQLAGIRAVLQVRRSRRQREVLRRGRREVREMRSQRGFGAVLQAGRFRGLVRRPVAS